MKVQRPNIRQQIGDDFEVLAEIATFLDAHTEMGKRYRFVSVLEEFRQTILHELNYEREAQNLLTVGANLADFPLITVPQPVTDYSSPSVLTMDYVRGQKVTKLSPLARLDLNGAELAEELFRAYLKQVLVDGLFHADPHPGNVFITEDGRIALLDLGMVGRTASGMQEQLLKLLLAVAEGRGEEAAEIVIRFSEKMEISDLAEFRRRISHLVTLQRDQGLAELNVGQTLLDVSGHARDNGLYVPSELTLLGKTLLQLDEVGRILDPTFDPNASVRRNVGELMTQRVKQDLTRGNAFSLDARNEGFPRQFAGTPQSRDGRHQQFRARGESEGGGRQRHARRHAKDREPHHVRRGARFPDHRCFAADAACRRGSNFSAIRVSRCCFSSYPRPMDSGWSRASTARITKLAKRAER